MNTCYSIQSLNLFMNVIEVIRTVGSDELKAAKGVDGRLLDTTSL